MNPAQNFEAKKKYNIVDQQEIISTTETSNTKKSTVKYNLKKKRKAERTWPISSQLISQRSANNAYIVSCALRISGTLPVNEIWKFQK